MSATVTPFARGWWDERAAADVGSLAVAPNRQHIALKYPLCLGPAFLFRAVAHHEIRDERLNRVGLAAALFFCCRIIAHVHRRQRFPRLVARIGQREQGIFAQCQFAGFSVVPIPDGPALRPADLNDKIQPRKPAIGNFAALFRVRFCGLNRSCCEYL